MGLINSQGFFKHSVKSFSFGRDRRQLGDPVLRQRALDKRVQVARAETKGLESVGDLELRQKLAQGVSQDQSSIFLLDFADVLA